jgi:hypothetical protein
MGVLLAVAGASLLSACGGGGSSSPSEPTYALGGTVTGLVAGGEILLLSGAGTQITLRSNGNFEFADRLKAGSKLTITVNRHPVGQTCTVSPDSGTIPTPGADVRNLTVVCNNNPHQLGGSVTGLKTGTSLTLTDGGRDSASVVVSSNGPFNFAARYAQGATYAVGILTQPVGQECRLTAPAGTFAAASVNTVSVNCSPIAPTLSGVISGLASGQRVTLANNGADKLTVSADGGFQFPAPVSYGGSYAVTVDAQPVAQVCTVAEGSGRNVVSNVTTVRVTCSARTYRIGGNVLGLSGVAGAQALTLANNGLDPVTISGNGAFSFATPQPSGSTYAVSVSAQPSGQLCSVTAGSGKVEADEVRSISVQCIAGGWRSRVLAGSGVGRTTDGTGTGAEFSAPGGSVLMPSGMILVTEISGSALRRVNPANGSVTTYSGSALPGFADSMTTRNASYRAPHALAIDRNGNLFVADTGNHVVRRIDAFSGAVTTLAGTGQPGSQDGPGGTARFNNPQGVAVDSAGNVYVADTGNHVIRRITPDRQVSTLAGSTGTPGFADGGPATALFRAPSGLAVDPAGQLLVSDSLNGAIRLVSTTGQVSTLAGNGTPGDADGLGTVARLANPSALFVDAQAIVYIADSGNHKVKTLQVNNGVGLVQTIAGTGTAGDADGEGLSIGLRQPWGLSMTSSGDLVVSEAGGHRLRLLSRVVPR